MTTSDTKDVAKTVEEVCDSILRCIGVVLSTVCGYETCINLTFLSRFFSFITNELMLHANHTVAGHEDSR
jgi:hypothetical protein